MAAVNTDRVWFIVRGMTQYVSRIYKNTKSGENSSDISEEDLYLPRRLKVVLSQSLDSFKDKKFVTAHNHVVNIEDREEHLKKSFRAGLLEVAKDRPHEEFLRECTLYIISATEQEILGFPEAKNIVMNAIYQVCMNTSQHESLVQWETQAGHNENSVIKDLNNQKPQNNGNDNHNDNNNDGDSALGTELEINIET